MPVADTWALGALAATAGIAEPTEADPAKPSATIAGMMIARPMRMTPPCQTSRPGPGAAPVTGARAPAGVITTIYAGESHCWVPIIAHTICVAPAGTMSFN